MASFTAVDLSKLQAPDLIEALDFETIFAEALAQFRKLLPAFSALTEADPVYKILQLFAARELLLRQRANDKAQQTMLAFATGANLDHLGALFGVARLVLDSGQRDIGLAPTYESDVDFRRRIQLAPEGFSVAGPKGAYIFHALSASADVMDASATSPAPGQVLVTVQSRTGDGTAPQELLDEVVAVLADDGVRPLTDEVAVQSAEIIRTPFVGASTPMPAPTRRSSSVKRCAACRPTLPKRIGSAVTSPNRPSRPSCSQMACSASS